MIDVIEAWLRLAAARLHEQTAALTALDQAIGDGDHGTNMDRGFTACVGQARRPRPTATSETPSGAFLKPVGQDADRTVGGASGPLYGTAFLRAAGRSPAGATRSSRRRRAGRRAAGSDRGHRDRSARRRPARRRCSMRLVPAVTAGRRRSPVGADAAAVSRGDGRRRRGRRAATIPMLATKGRASYLGERSHRTPGSGRDVVGAAAACPRRRRERLRGATMAQAILVGRAGSPGVGTGRLLRVRTSTRPRASPAPVRRPRQAVSATVSACPRQRGVGAGGARRPAIPAGGRGGGLDLRGAGPVRPRSGDRRSRAGAGGRGRRRRRGDPARDRRAG